MSVQPSNIEGPGHAPVEQTHPDPLDRVSVPVVVVDRQGLIIRSNREFNRSAGGTDGEPAGRYVWEQEMEIASRHIGDVTILDLNGKLTIGTGDVALRGAMLTEINEGKKKVLINLQEVKAIDSSGLGELIRCRATAASNEAEVKLLHVNLKARKLLTMARLVGVFDMFDDEEMAIASFG